MNQFRNVDGSEATMTLGQIKTNQAFDFDLWDCTGFNTTDTIQLFGADGKSKGMLTYCSKSYIEDSCGTTATEGWYPVADAMVANFSNCKNSEVLKFGDGFIVQAGQGNGTLPQLVFSGEVKNSVSDIPGIAFSFTGNCSPIDITLGAIKTNQEFDFDLWDCTGFTTTDTIQLFGSDGKSKGMLTYCSKSYIEDSCGTTATEGWYPVADAMVANFADCRNATPLAAGDSFVMQCGNGNGITPLIKIPCALPSKEDK